MDRMKSLSEAIRMLVEGEFSGYVKINFSQGSLGRVEKYEEFYNSAAHSMGEQDSENKIKEKEFPLRKAVPVLFLCLTALAGCMSVGKVAATRPDASDMPKTSLVQTGDLVDLRFLCRLQSGEVVAATDRSLGQRPDVPKSTIFLMRDKDGPVSVKADVLLPMMERPAGKELAFEDEIVERLAGAVLGMKEGEDRTVRLTAQEAPERRPEDYVMKVARVRVRSKEMRMSIDEFRSRIGWSPEAGQTVLFDPAIPGRVETVMSDEAVIRFSAQPGAVTSTPFGPGHIRETEKAYEIVIDARKGALVRTGMLVGRIVDVDENYITIDYRHPFGNEVLVCDVAVDKIADAKPINNGSGE
jgi:FKBP-type peptidyl-prolyl cis-trans isomerase 2